MSIAPWWWTIIIWVKWTSAVFAPASAEVDATGVVPVPAGV
jgi:hypothetical protein